MRKILKYFLRSILVLFVLVNVITAFHAYKFTHFYDANEISIKSKEDKGGWDITKEMLFGINAIKGSNKEVADSSLQTVYFTTKDNIKIEGWYINTHPTSKGTVILFHGHGGTKSAVMNEAEAFKKMGYNTLLVDFRAHGSSGGNTCTIGFYETEEVKLAYDFVKQKGENNIILWGISMGAATIIKAMDDYPLQPSKIIAEMPFGSIVEAAGSRIKMKGLPAQPLATLITFWGGVEHGFWAFNMKPSQFAKKIKVPALLQWGKNDPRVTQKETNHIFNNLQGPKHLVVYENSGHESLCKSEHAKWLNEVQNFLSK
ncbi:MAG: alpha/beta fold hydrolase [Ferruginibacter sp.]